MSKIKARRWIIHVNMTCETCGKVFQDYKKPNAPNQHAHATGHKVVGEIGYGVEYKP